MGLGDILWSIIGGTIIGVIAKLVMPGRQNVGFILTVLVGIVGMFVGDFLARAIGVEETGGVDWIRHTLQVVVAVAGLAGLGAVLGRKST